jgi:transcriptional regulator with XRE-family HTH domain
MQEQGTPSTGQVIVGPWTGSKVGDRAPRIRELRKFARLTKKQLAADLGVDRDELKQWERGEEIPPRTIREALADLFAVKADYLMGWEDDHLMREFLARRDNRRGT